MLPILLNKPPILLTEIGHFALLLACTQDIFFSRYPDMKVVYFTIMLPLNGLFNICTTFLV